jgi:quinol monooxygenase YgiN
MAPDPSEEVELTMVTMTFDALDPETLQSVLARYVVLSRGHRGCRNIDLAMSTTQPNRFVVVQKWERPEDQQAHFDSPDMITMAESCAGLLSAPPAIDLLEPISAHDLH